VLAADESSRWNCGPGPNPSADGSNGSDIQLRPTASQQEIAQRLGRRDDRPVCGASGSALACAPGEDARGGRRPRISEGQIRAVSERATLLQRPAGGTHWSITAERPGASDVSESRGGITAPAPPCHSAVPGSKAFQSCACTTIIPVNHKCS